MSDAEKNTESAAPKKKRSKLLWLAPLVLLLTGVPAGAYFWMQHRAAGSGGEAAPKPDHSGVMPLDPFTVNLADKDSPRFLRITISLVVDENDSLDELRKDALKQARLRSTLLELLSQQIAEHLTSTDGKKELKHAIAERATDALKPLKVTDVLFSDFVVQF